MNQPIPFLRLITSGLFIALAGTNSAEGLSERTGTVAYGSISLGGDGGFGGFALHSGGRLCNFGGVWGMWCSDYSDLAWKYLQGDFTAPSQFANGCSSIEDDVFPDNTPPAVVSLTGSHARIVTTKPDDVFPPGPLAEPAKSVVVVFPAKDPIFPDHTTAAPIKVDNPAVRQTGSEIPDDFFKEGADTLPVEKPHPNPRVAVAEDDVFTAAPESESTAMEEGKPVMKGAGAVPVADNSPNPNRSAFEVNDPFAPERIPSAPATETRSPLAILAIEDDVFPADTSPAATSLGDKHTTASAMTPAVASASPANASSATVVATPPFSPIRPGVAGPKNPLLVTDEEAGRPHFRGPKNRPAAPPATEK